MSDTVERIHQRLSARQQLLDINLSTLSITLSEINSELIKKALGGRALGLSLYNDNHQSGTQSNDLSDNQLDTQSDHNNQRVILSTSPLCNIPSLSASMLAVTFKSPLNLTVSTWSCNGAFAAALNSCEIDAIRISGRANNPVTLHITNGLALLVDAGDQWTMTTDDFFNANIDATSLLSIGPAGECGGHFGELRIDRENIATRGGVGGLLGSMNLKAVIVQGDSETSTHNTTRAVDTEDIDRLIKASPYLSGTYGIGSYGTATLIDLIEERRMTLTQGYLATSFPESRNYSATTLKSAFNPSKSSCPGCTVGCRLSTDNGPIPDAIALSAFGSQILNDDFDITFMANRRCNELGIDPLCASTSFSLAKKSDPQLSLKDIIPFIDRLASDSDLQSQIACSTEYKQLCVKNLPLPLFDPRGGCGIALGFSTSTRGADYQFTQAYTHEILRKPVPTDRFSLTGKARINVLNENAIAAAESLGICPHILTAVSLEEYLPHVQNVTGDINWSIDRLMMLGEKVILTERHLNAQSGITIAEDDLPEIFFKEDGNNHDDFSVPCLERQAFLTERENYYKIRGLTHNAMPPSNLNPKTLL